MTLRFAKGYGLGIAALVGVVGTASAQTSDQRVKVVKDMPGDVVTRVDTVTITRVDTVRVNNTVFRTDTVRVAGPTVTNTNTVVRYDTVTREVLPGWMSKPKGLYFGLGAGTMYPQGSLFAAQHVGYAMQGQVGYDAAGPLGLRADVNWGRPDEHANYASGRARPEMLNVSADLKLKAPTISQRFPLTLYAIGGGTYTRYKDLLIQLDEPTAGTIGDNVAPSDQAWHDKYGFNAGVGGAFGWGKTQLFLETRILSFKPANAEAGKQMPIILGINWY